MATPLVTSNPYIGPRAFQTGEHIYGRERETGQLVNLITAERIVLLHSPSGAGKTSLIQAAVIPLLLKRRLRVLPTVRVNLDPVARVSSQPTLNRYVFSVLASLEEGLAAEEQLAPDRLAQMTLSEYLEERGPTNSGPAMQVLIFDQFEEILTLNPTDTTAKQAFFQQIGAVLEAPNRWALFAMREDYVAALDPYKIAVPSRFTTTFRLDLLGQAAACEAIQKPAREAGVEFEDAAVEKLVDDLRRVRVQMPDGSVEPQLGPHIEPLQLQVVCHRLWESSRHNAGRITLEDLAAFGEMDRSLVDQSLAHYYAERVGATAAATGVSERSIREWFDRRLITEQRLRGTVLMGKERSGDLDNRSIRMLIDAYLVRGEKRGGATWFELSHDRLIQPIIADNAEWFKAHLSLLQQRADLWNGHDRPESMLLRGPELVEAQQWAKAHDAELLQSERDYLAASQELARRALRIRRRNQIISVLAIAAVMLSALALLALKQASVQRDEARRQERIARSGELAAQSAAALPDLPARSLLLAVEAISVSAKAGGAGLAQAENALRTTLAEPRGIPLSAHGGSIKALAFSPDGRWLATGSDDHSLRLWPIAAGGNPQVLGGYQTGLTAVVFSPDGHWLAAGSTDKDTRLWDLGNARPAKSPLVLPGDGSGAYVIGFSPDRRWLAAGSLDGRVLVWNTADLGPSAKPTVLPSPQDSILALAFSPDGRWLATGSNDRTVSVWDLAAKDLASTGPRVYRGHTGAIESLVFSPDGRWLASGSRDWTVRLWDMKSATTETQPQVLEGAYDWVNAVTFSPDSRWLATGSGDKTVRLWELDAKGEAVFRHALTGHSGAISTVAFSPDGHWLASGSADGTARLWNMAEPDPIVASLVLHGHDDGVTSLTFSPDSRWLATGSKDGSARLWVVGAVDPTGDPLVLRDHRAYVNAIAFSPDGRWLATGGGDSSQDQTDAAVRLWSRNAAGQVETPTVLSGNDRWIDALGFSPDGRWLAGAGGDATVRLWNVRAGSPVSSSQPLAGHSAWVDALAFSPDGRWLATGSQDSTVRLWDLRAGSPGATGRVLKGRDGRVSAVAFSRDGRWLAAANEYVALLWDLGSAAQTDKDLQPRLLSGHSDFVSGVAFSPDGHWLATGSDDKTVRLWDLAAGDPAAHPVELAGHTDQVKLVTFSPDGQWLATGGKDKAARLWRMNSGGADPHPIVLPEHLRSITALAFSTDSQVLASASEDGAVRLWDVRSADPAAEPVLLQGHTDAVTALVFSPDGRQLASSGKDGTVRLWSLSLDELVGLACRDAGRNLSEQEWRSYFPGEARRRTCSQWP